jgi:hypothetical protein
VDRVKRSLRRAIELLGSIVGRLQVLLVTRASGGAPVWVLDLDNTLADTWPSYLGRHASERARLRGLDPLPGMLAAAHEPARAAGGRVVVLSHRNLWHWPVTRSWLRANGVDVGWTDLVLVASPADKIAHLRRLCAGGRDVTYWDDLTHGTERGRHGSYDEVVDAVRRLPLAYHGEAEIARVVAAVDPGRAARVSALLAAAGVVVDGGVDPGAGGGRAGDAATDGR